MCHGDTCARPLIEFSCCTPTLIGLRRELLNGASEHHLMASKHGESAADAASRCYRQGSFVQRSPHEP